MHGAYPGRLPGTGGQGARILKTCALLEGTEIGTIEAACLPSHWELADTTSRLKDVKSVDFTFTEYALCSRPRSGTFVSLLGVFLPLPVPGTFCAAAMS